MSFTRINVSCIEMVNNNNNLALGNALLIKQLNGIVCFYLIKLLVNDMSNSVWIN